MKPYVQEDRYPYNKRNVKRLSRNMRKWAAIRKREERREKRKADKEELKREWAHVWKPQ